MPQSLSNRMTHLVFSTKNRQPMLRAQLRTDMHRYLAGISGNLKCPAIEIGGIEDHVHLLFVLSRTESVAEVTQRLKANSTTWIRDRVPEFSWQAGYGSFSVGRTEREMVAQYIRGQEDHHRRVTFQDEYRRMLVEHEVPFDERYLWD